MQTFMLKLDRWLSRHRRAVIGVWLVLLLAALPFAAKQSDHLSSGGYAIPRSQSQRFVAQLPKISAGAPRGLLAGVLEAKVSANATEMTQALAKLDTAAAGAANVSLSPAVHAQAQHAIDTAGDRQHTLVVPLTLSVNEEGAGNVATELRQRLNLNGPDSGPVELHLVGQNALWAGLQDLSKKDLATAEKIGFPIVALILVAVFGSLIAATLPLALGAVSVLITGAIIYFLSLTMEMSVFVTNMASMIGIGVAVDYSLFVLARYRQEIGAGAEPEQARATALATSGVAVIFSGATVVTALLGLYIVHAAAIRSMALGAIVVVAVSVLAASTLLPTLISLLGTRTHARGRVFSWISSRMPSPKNFWERWTALVTRRPTLTAATAAIVMLGLAFPALKLHTADGALRQFPKGNETLRGFQAAASVEGPGASSPIEVRAPASEAAKARQVLTADTEVRDIAATITSKDGSEVLIRAIPRHDGESAQGQLAVKQLRANLPAGALVGGTAAYLSDYHAEVMGSMWKVALFVMCVTFFVLMLLLRSIVLPLKAVVMNLLSVSAAYGVLTLVFGTVETLIPPLVLAVVFGLSMDYEVFLLSRIRERYAATGDTRRAVVEGLSSSAPTITSAALIMVCVFSVFALTGVPSIKELGLGCALAIAIDATIVRLVLVPTAMELFGKWNWWLPHGLARYLPDTSVEALGQHAVAAVTKSERRPVATDIA
ncbi:MAG TPA: MMPL family transporter [Solirubrobacteraceae bacterium]|jgi:RND superfamily putative drug exporter|nr:MMPL family transporter [Solirubrobacteraceae bacterium]